MKFSLKTEPTPSICVRTCWIRLRLTNVKFFHFFFVKVEVLLSNFRNLTDNKFHLFVRAGNKIFVEKPLKVETFLERYLKI